MTPRRRVTIPVAAVALCAAAIPASGSPAAAHRAISPFGAACVDIQGIGFTPQPQHDAAMEQPGPLAPRPVVYDAPVYTGADGKVDVPVIDAARVPGGMMLAVSGSDQSGTFAPGSILTVINDDGTLRWRRCLDTKVALLSALPTAATVLAVHGDSSAITAVNDVDAATGEFTADRFPALRDQLHGAPQSASQDGNTATFVGPGGGSAKVDLPLPPGVTLAPASAHPAAILDDERTVVGPNKAWHRDDLHGLSGEYAPVLTLGARVIANVCIDDPATCEKFTVVGLDAKTGTLVWTIKGDNHILSYLTLGNTVLVSTGDGAWQQLDSVTGRPVGGVLFANGFDEGCCGDETQWASGFGGVAITGNGGSVQMWMPRAALDTDGPSPWTFGGMADVPAMADPALRGAGCPQDTPAAVPDGWWYGFVHGVNATAIQYDIACATITGPRSSRTANNNPRTREILLGDGFVTEYDVATCADVPDSAKHVPNDTSVAWLYVSGGHAMYLRQSCNTP